MIDLLVVDDEAAARESMTIILDAEPDLHVLGTAADGQQALDRIDRLHPHVVVMDLRMPGMDGLAASRALAGRPPRQPAVLALTTFATDTMAVEAIRAGAAGFCTKADPPAALAAAIRTVHHGDAVVSPAILKALLGRIVHTGPQRPLPAGLTPRELDVLHRVARGDTNTDIMRHLHISEATVRSHIAHLRTKLRARSRAELVVRAWEAGQIGARSAPEPPAG